MARPRKTIDKKQFENLCALQCTEVEICGWFDVCTETLNSWCKREYGGLCFSEVYAQKRGKGRISLRRQQFQLAEKGNASMLIWLGKQYLGQRDTPSVDVRIGEIEDDDLSRSLKEIGEGL